MTLLLVNNVRDLRFWTQENETD